MKRLLPLLLVLLLLSGCAPAPVRRGFVTMDTAVELTVYGNEADLDAAEALILALEDELSATDPGSALSALNASDGAPVALPDDLARVLADALAVSADTDGAFDPTVYPFVRAWGFPDDNFRVPADSEIESLLPLVGVGHVRLEGSTGTLDPGCALDLGGIAKGYASRRVTDLLAERGVTSAIVSLGGNVQALGTKPDSSPWQVAVTDPSDPSAQFAALAVADTAVVTAGGYERNFTVDGVVYAHILDPDTGRPAVTDLDSVTVLTPDGALADALSTALYVMGLDAALAYRASHPGFGLVLVSGRDVYVTADLRDAYLPLSDDYNVTFVD